MSRDIPDTPNPCLGVGVFGFSRWWPGWSAGGLVVAGGIEGEVAEGLAGGGVDDADVEAGDEQEDGGSGLGHADADVVEAAGVAEGDFAGGVDVVVANAVVSVAVPAGCGGFGPRLVGGGGGDVAGEGAVGAVVVVVVDEGVEEGLQLGNRGGLVGLGAEPSFEGLVEAFDLAAGGGVVGPRVLLADSEAA